MKLKTIAASLLIVIGISIAFAAELDPRFEGVWIGRETYKIEASATQDGRPPRQMEAAIVIDPKSKQFGVIEGLGKGKYEATKDSSGTALKFSSNLTGSGRNKLTFDLSADGSTITETGFGTYPCKPYACTCTISGTFHRRGGAKK